MLVHSGGTITLRSCEIFTKYNPNAFISIEDANSKLDISNSKIRGYTVGIFAKTNAICTIKDSSIYENALCKILIRNCTANVQNCEIYNHSSNKTSAVVFESNASGSVTNCKFKNNAIYALFIDNGCSVRTSGNTGL